MWSAFMAAAIPASCLGADDPLHHRHLLSCSVQPYPAAMPATSRPGALALNQAFLRDLPASYACGYTLPKAPMLGETMSRIV